MDKVSSSDHQVSSSPDTLAVMTFVFSDLSSCMFSFSLFEMHLVYLLTISIHLTAQKLGSLAILVLYTPRLYIYYLFVSFKYVKNIAVIPTGIEKYCNISFLKKSFHL